MKVFFTKNFFATLVISLMAFGLVFMPSVALAQQAANFQTGDLLVVTNGTSGSGAWTDSVNGTPGEVIEFNMLAKNTGSGTATNVKVTASLPSTPANNLQASATVSADNGSSVSDTATVNITSGGPQGFAYIPGHVRIFSTACPSGCAGPDTVTSGGVSVGNLAPGQSAQVLWKAYITNTPQATAAPTAAPTATPGVGGTTQSCSAGQVMVGTDQSGAIICQTISINNSNTNTNTSSNTVNVNSPAATTAPVVVKTVAAKLPSELKELPQTGLPLAAWGLSGLLPLGYKLRRFGRSSEKLGEVDPVTLWMERQTKGI